MRNLVTDTAGFTGHITVLCIHLGLELDGLDSINEYSDVVLKLDDSRGRVWAV